MVVVKRSALKMWLLAMAGIPLLVISLDVLTRRRITNWLREIVFRPEDTQIFEPRDVIWAWAMLLFAGFLVLWGLKELFLPTRIIECRFDGLALKVAGPTRRPTLVPWRDIDDVYGSTMDDEGETLPTLVLRVVERGDLPENPWGARWIDETRIGILAQDWAAKPADVAADIVECAVQMAKEEAREKIDQLSASLEEE